MKRMLKIGFILCMAFSLIACSFLQALTGELEEEAAETEYIPTEPVEPEIEQFAPTDALTEAPTPISLVHRIVYEKTGNIWAVDPGTNEVVQITQDGSIDSTASGAVKYFRPLSSPDGAYVAFSTSTRFCIYSFASLEIDEIVKASSPDILADVLLGWSEDNLLYYTRTNGGCDLSVTPLKGPDSVDVMRYDPVSGSSEKVSTLPKVEDASHAYSIGKNMTPSGRFITAYNAACSVGFGSTFLWDVQNETYAMNPQGDAILSNDESTIAYVDDTNFEMAGLTTIVGVDRVSQSQETLYAPSMAGYVMTDVSWSPDDSFIAFLEWYVLDPAQARGMGG
ncbi:MAG: hypothetical protein K8R77_07365, partial [Anaerolineaceae bacterium]|nr:hypothetical protein [Anaerolineaceae bacterium]